MKTLDRLTRLVSSPAAPLLIAGGGTALRGLGLGESLWFDEAFTARLAQLPWGRFWEVIKNDSAPPGWPLIEFVTVRLLGNSETALRLPAMLLGVGIMFLIWRIGLRIGLGRGGALLAMLLAAWLPVGLYFSTEARQYNLLAFGVLLALWGLLRDNAPIAAGGMITAMYAQNVGIVYSGVLLVLYSLSKLGTKGLRKKHPRTSSNPQKLIKATLMSGGLRKPVLIALACGAAMAPWIGTLAGQIKSVGGSFWLPPFTMPQLLTPLVSMVVGWRVPESAQIGVAIVGLGCTMLGLCAAWPWLKTKRGLLVLGVFALAPLALGAVSTVWRNIYLPRALLPSALCVCFLWASAMMSAPILNGKAVALFVAPMLFLTAVWFADPPINAGRVNMPDFFKPIRDNWQQGDVVYHGNEATEVLAEYYLPGLPHVVRPNSGDFMSIPDGVKVAMAIHAQSLEGALATHCRVWAVYSIMPTSTSDEVKEAAMLPQFDPLPFRVLDRGSDQPRSGLFLIQRC